MNADPLLSVVEVFLSVTRMSARTFGSEVMGDPCFVFDLRRGRECRRATRARVMAQIAAHQSTGHFDQEFAKEFIKERAAQ